MTEASYDLIVIGAGMAGTSAAAKCASRGWRVAIVDSLPYGGTCALRGCDPKKILRRAAEVVEDARLMRGRGITGGEPSIHWGELMAHKHGFTDPVPGSIEKRLQRASIRTIHGGARFVAPDRLTVDSETLDGRHILIAAGARPRPLDFPGHEHLVDSTEFLNLEALPRRIVFIGGGFVSFEFAHIAARAGSTVTIIDRGERPLKEFDPDLVDLLVIRGGEAGVDVRRRSTVTRVTPTSSGLRVELDEAGAPSAIEADLVVHGAGRVPDLARLDLEAAEVAHSVRGVTVAPHLQSTTNPSVYAAGDAADTAGLPLTPVAVFEAKVAASNMLASDRNVPDYSAVPTAVFTIPELVRVGLLEQEARQMGLAIDVRYTDTSHWYSNYRIGETAGAAKIIVDTATDRILGAHLFGAGYAELVTTVSLAMKLGATTRQVKSMTAAYPTVGSDLASML